MKVKVFEIRRIGPVQSGLQFTTKSAQVMNHGERQIIAVGVTPDWEGPADLKYVLTVTEIFATQTLNLKSLFTNQRYLLILPASFEKNSIGVRIKRPGY